MHFVQLHIYFTSRTDNLIKHNFKYYCQTQKLFKSHKCIGYSKTQNLVKSLQ